MGPDDDDDEEESSVTLLNRISLLISISNKMALNNRLTTGKKREKE
jgi:hypothetical protein